jgi:hypothetical protein
MPRDFLPAFNVAANLGFAKGVLLLDDCEGTFTWTVGGTGGDDVHEYAAVAAFMGLNGMRLKTRTTGAAADDNVFVSKVFGFPESGLVVARMRWASPDPTKIKSVRLNLWVDNGVRDWQAGGRLLPNTPEFDYYTPAGAWQAVASMAFGVSALEFVTMELVVDCRAMGLLEVANNGVRTQLSGVGLYDNGAYTNRRCAVAIMVYAIGANPAEMYVDHVYVGEFLGA